MKFGRLEDVGNVDFSLPNKILANAKILASGKDSNVPLQIYLGCPAWGNKEWKTKIYPVNAKNNEFLKYYAENFNTVELNSSHYSIPANKTILKWCEMVGDDFKFCPKYHQAVSHHNKLVDCQGWLDSFYEMTAQFGSKLGTCFLQLSPSLIPEDINALESILANRPKGFELAVEFRNENWFQVDAWNSTLELLQKYNASTVITDTAGRRDVSHMNLTNDTAFIRFVGNNLHPTDFTRIDNWISEIEKWRAAGLQKLYFIIHEPDEFYCPELAQYFAKNINLRLNTNLKPIQIKEKPIQGSLF